MADRPAFIAPLHIISYGSLLGAQVYQTFVSAPLSFRALPRPQFAALQSAIFAAYFSIQTTLPLIVAATYPYRLTSPSGGLCGRSSGLQCVFAEGNRANTLVPLLTTVLAGLVNGHLVEPLVTRIMEERKRQESIDGKKSYDPPPRSDAMTRLNKSFGRMHGISSLVNLLGLVATVYYGTVLAGRID